MVLDAISYWTDYRLKFAYKNQISMTLYHYCSNYAFHSIISQKSVRLSLLSLSNDSKEGRHIIDIANRLLPNELTHKNDILRQLKITISLIPAIGFCLSAEGDVLSQWRAYADNAQGVAIGFDRKVLKTVTTLESDEDLIVRLTPIAYDSTSLEKFVKEDLQPIVEHYESGKMTLPKLGSLLLPLSEEEKNTDSQRYKESGRKLFDMLMKIVNYAYSVKSPFFREEKEWRILALLVTKETGLILPDVQFQPTAEKLMPFRNFPLNGFSPSLIREIVLGPRNETPDDVIKLFLNSEGFGHVEIRRSYGSYN